MTATESVFETQPLGSGWAIKHGLIGGFLAGVVFAMGEMIAARLMQGDALMPLHMIAGLPLQQDPKTIAPATAVPVGMIAHMAYSMALAAVLALVVAIVPGLRASGARTVIFATIIGFLIWPLNFYVIAPLLNAPWFATDTEPVLQFVFHTFLYGTVLGMYLAARLPER
ncbi:MAG: hypothetical protein ABR599_02530 [Gemmatimonadota bacterium]